MVFDKQIYDSVIDVRIKCSTTKRLLGSPVVQPAHNNWLVIRKRVEWEEALKKETPYLYHLRPDRVASVVMKQNPSHDKS